MTGHLSHSVIRFSTESFGKEGISPVAEVGTVRDGRGETRAMPLPMTNAWTHPK